MKKYFIKKLTLNQKSTLIKRKQIDSESVLKSVKKICSNVKHNGLTAAIKYAQKFDGFDSNTLFVTEDEFTRAEELLSRSVKLAIHAAYENIYKFHEKQYPSNYTVKTMNGINCERRFIPIQNVGLYIPSGTAPLPSTVLMLGVAAQIARCPRIIAASPTKGNIHPAILYAAKLCNIKQFIKIGGAQAIALFAYGDPKFKKVDKIFGPGNQYVTAAKALVSTDPDGCAIDMIAGPTELLIIADDSANPNYLASDLISQAEHGKDSNVVLLSTSENLINQVNDKIKSSTQFLPRKKIVYKALKNSFSVLFDNLYEAFEFSNEFAPEHLLLNIKNPEKYLSKVINAGSVFVGDYTPVSAGDYASGTNHTLPTYGFARSQGGLSVEMFMKGITFQAISKHGIKNLSKTVITLAETELLQAHAEAVKVRLSK